MLSERRLKRLGVTVELATDLLRNGKVIVSCKCTNGLPADAVIRDARMSADHRQIDLLVESAEFDVVGPDEEVPWSTVAYEVVTWRV